MKKIITTILLLIMLLFFTGVTLATTGKVNTTQLNLRESASTDAKVLTQLTSGAELNIVSEEGNWYKVTYNDYTGYVSKDYVTKNAETTTTNTETSANTETAQTETETYSNKDGVLVSDAQLYVLPLLNSTKLDVIKSGTNLKVISTNGKWAYIQTDKLSGWLFISRVSITGDTNSNSTQTSNTETNTTSENAETKTADSTTQATAKEYPKTMYLNANSVYIRKSADKTSDIITSITLNTEVTVLGISGDWYQVKYNGDTGYIYKQFLSTTKK